MKLRANASPIPQRAPEPDLQELHSACCLPALQKREFTHAEFWEALDPLLEEGSFLRRRIGNSCWLNRSARRGAMTGSRSGRSDWEAASRDRSWAAIRARSAPMR